MKGSGIRVKFAESPIRPVSMVLGKPLRHPGSLVVLLGACEGARAWQWQRPFGAFPGFRPRDGACIFTYFNDSDRSFRVGLFGGTTVGAESTSKEPPTGVNSPTVRRAFNDVWFSPAVERWVGGSGSSGLPERGNG